MANGGKRALRRDEPLHPFFWPGTGSLVVHLAVGLFFAAFAFPPRSPAEETDRVVWFSLFGGGQGATLSFAPPARPAPPPPAPEPAPRRAALPPAPPAAEDGEPEEPEQLEEAKPTEMAMSRYTSVKAPEKKREPVPKAAARVAGQAKGSEPKPAAAKPAAAPAPAPAAVAAAPVGPAAPLPVAAAPAAQQPAGAEPKPPVPQQAAAAPAPAPIRVAAAPTPAPIKTAAAPTPAPPRAPVPAAVRTGVAEKAGGGLPIPPPPPTDPRGDLRLRLSGAGATTVKATVTFRRYPVVRRSIPARRPEPTTPARSRIVRPATDVLEVVIDRSAEGVYEFFAESPGEERELAALVKIREETREARVKKIGHRRVGQRESICRILMPEGILWEDTEAFTGSIDDGESITKFNADTGLTWKEFR